MKFNKTILTTAILASSLVLTACNEKKAETKAPVEKAKTEQVAKQDNKKTETINKIAPTTLALYNATLQVAPTSINIVKDKNDIPSIQYAYKITNTGTQPILAALWVNQMVYQNHLIDIQLIDVPFKNGLAPNTTIDLAVTKPLKNYPENIRNELVKGGQVSLPTIAGTIVYANNSSVSVVPTKLLVNYVQQQQQNLQKAKNDSSKKVAPTAKEAPKAAPVKKATAAESKAKK